MSYRVELSGIASREIRQRYRRIADNNRRAAERWQASLLAALDSLADHPERFPLAPEDEWHRRGLREMLFGKRSGMYRILYYVHDTVVFIARVRHAAQDWLQPGDLEEVDADA